MTPKKSILTSAVLWWLRNYYDVVHTWIRSNWCIAITIFVIGALSGWHLQTAALLILAVGLVLNIGLYFGIRTLNAYMKGLPEGSDKEEIHEEMIKYIKGRIKRGR